MVRRIVLQPAPGTTLHVAASDEGICRISFTGDLPDEDWPVDEAHPLLIEAKRQLEFYFAGRLQSFDLPLDLQGTPFQHRVWQRLRKIPYGRTITYAELAAGVGSPTAFRAVGAANGQNPVPIIVPCHRVINSGGGLGGFSGGLDYKRRLLDLESGRISWTAASAQVALELA